jgi:hypothetical protein
MIWPTAPRQYGSIFTITYISSFFHCFMDNNTFRAGSVSKNWFAYAMQELSETGLPDSLGRNIPKRGKMYQKTLKCTECHKCKPRRRKIFQMAIKYINIFNSEALQSIPKLKFLVWNIYHLAALERKQFPRETLTLTFKSWIEDLRRVKLPHLCPLCSAFLLCSL